jgi:hypothetical protein
VSAARGTVRRQVRIARAPDDVWAIVGDAARLHEWFPGIVDCTVDLDAMTRVIFTGSGIPMPEDLVTIDPLLRRFQYRITVGLFREHLSTIDVLDLEDGTSLVVYGVDAEPATMALIIGGAAGNALENLRRIMEGS